MSAKIEDLLFAFTDDCRVLWIDDQQRLGEYAAECQCDRPMTNAGRVTAQAMLAACGPQEASR